MAHALEIAYSVLGVVGVGTFRRQPMVENQVGSDRAKLEVFGNVVWLREEAMDNKSV